MTDTIYALATGIGTAAIAVIRLSGSHAVGALEAITRKTRPQQRRMVRRWLYQPNQPNQSDLDQSNPDQSNPDQSNPDQSKSHHGLQGLHDPYEAGFNDETPLDDAMVVWFAGPHSYTGEDIVELHLHGGRAVVEGVLGALRSLGHLRLAEAGEFTKRAWLNGRMDLTEVEGVADLIHAETQRQRRQAIKRVNGELASTIEAWREGCLSLRAQVEAFIEFPDETGAFSLNAVGSILQGTEKLARGIEDHLKQAQRGERLRRGVGLAIVGPPNAGKSTMINALTKRDIAIVSALPGTTRDVLEAAIDWQGYPLIIADTAGMRPSDDPIEQEGIARAERALGNADIVMVMVDHRDVATETALINVTSPFLHKTSEHQEVLIVCNKVDEPSAAVATNVTPLNSQSHNDAHTHGVQDARPAHLAGLASGTHTSPDASNTSTFFGAADVLPDVLVDSGTKKPIIRLSLKTGHGWDAFALTLTQALEKVAGGEDAALAVSHRQQECLHHTVYHLRRALDCTEIELISEELRMASRHLGMVTGVIGIEHTLDIIFSRFCIGK